MIGNSWIHDVPSCINVLYILLCPKYKDHHLMSYKFCNLQLLRDVSNNRVKFFFLCFSNEYKKF